MKRIGVLALVGLVVLGLNSCILDPKEEKRDDPPVSPYLPLDGERDNVLFNLQKAYNERNLERYDELLDTDFVFFFSNTDVNNGTVQYDQWGRAAEIGANRNLFDPTFSKPGVDPASVIDLTLSYATGDDQWIQVTPPDQVKYPDETWYEKIVTYSLTVKAGDMEYVGNDIQASFTVRWATDDEGNEYWRVIIWRDDTGSKLNA